jgi:hypothetical protein
VAEAPTLTKKGLEPLGIRHRWGVIHFNLESRSFGAGFSSSGFEGACLQIHNRSDWARRTNEPPTRVGLNELKGCRSSGSPNEPALAETETRPSYVSFALNRLDPARRQRSAGYLP